MLRGVENISVKKAETPLNETTLRAMRDVKEGHTIKCKVLRSIWKSEMKYELEFTRQLNSSLRIVTLVRTGSHSDLF